MQRSALAAWMLVLALAAGCGKSSPTPVSPSSGEPVGGEAKGDGAGLKATAPTPVSPINGAKPTDPQLLLVVRNASMKFGVSVPLAYRFEIYDSRNVRIYQSGLVPEGSGGTTSHEPIEANLEADQPYRWQARAEYLGVPGPWSEQASFRAPDVSGWIRDYGVYDPLYNGRTVGKIFGPVTWVPGVGVKLEDFTSYIKYELPQTLTEGEFSLLVTDMPANTEGGKTKLFAMSEGDADIVTNDRRMTVEKRGDPPGVIAWRFITSLDQVDTEGAERVAYDFQDHLTYFWEATWRNNFFNVLIREGGASGATIYEFGKHYEGVYDPNPHYAYIGAPVGRSGPEGASVPGVVIRQVWISNRPRPGYANR